MLFPSASAEEFAVHYDYTSMWPEAMETGIFVTNTLTDRGRIFAVSLAPAREHAVRYGYTLQLRLSGTQNGTALLR